MDGLTAAQQDLVSQFESITATSDTGNSIAVLRECGWNIEAAITKIYDPNYVPTPTPSASSSVPTPARSRDPLEVDDLGGLEAYPPPSGPVARARNTRSEGPSWWRSMGLPVQLLTWPLRLGYQVVSVFLGFLARIFRIRPSLSSLRPRNPLARDPSTRPRRSDPITASERWVAQLASSLGIPREDGQRAGSSSSAGPSSEGLRRREAGDGRKLLDFYVGGYNDALRKAKAEIRLLLVVLTCEEHQDDQEFKERVLCDPELGEALRREGVLVWGGDIGDRDAFQTSGVLQALTYPFLAFVSLQPKPGQSAAFTASPVMSIVSRLEGPPSSTTSAPAVLAALNNVVVPRVTPFLQRLRSVQASREADRLLRAEQDRAYEQAARKDTERVLAKRAEEAAKAKAIKDAASAAARAESDKKKRAQWVEWARSELGPEPKEGEARVSVRLGDGRRVLRRFGKGEAVERIYMFVECELLPSSSSSSSSASSSTSSPPAGYIHSYAFKLATTFPRVVLEPSSIKIGSVKELEGAQNLVVEGLDRRSLEGSRDDFSDEEEEEEEEED